MAMAHRPHMISDPVRECAYPSGLIKDDTMRPIGVMDLACLRWRSDMGRQKRDPVGPSQVRIRAAPGTGRIISRP